MPSLSVSDKWRAERVKAVRTLLEQRASMERMNLSELEWVLFRLGCSIAEAEKLIKLAGQCDTCAGRGKLRGKDLDAYSVVACASCSGSGLSGTAKADRLE